MDNMMSDIVQDIRASCKLAFKSYKKNWSGEFVAGGQIFAEVKIQRRIFKRDPLLLYY